MRNSGKVLVVCAGLVVAGAWLIPSPAPAIRTSAIVPVVMVTPSTSAAPSPVPSESPSPSPSPSSVPAPARQTSKAPPPKPKVISVSISGPSITCDGGKVKFSAHIKSNVEIERIVHRVNATQLGGVQEQIAMLVGFERTVTRTDVVSAATVEWSMRFEAMDGQKLTKSGSAGNPC